MTNDDLLGALGGAPVFFEANGVKLQTKRLTFAQAQQYREFRAKNPDAKDQHLAALIAVAVRTADGTPIPYAVAYQLPADVADVIAAKVADVNGWGDGPKNS